MGDTYADVYIVGTGMVGYRQLTRECEQVFDLAAQIFVLHPLPEVRTYFRDCWDSVVDLTDEYEQGAKRSQKYEQMAQRVLDGATQSAGPVVLAVYGHPKVGVSPTENIQKRVEKTDITVEVFPGVSSIDCLYVDLGIDPFTRGLQMFEATDLLIYEQKLNPTIPAFVFQIGLVESRLYDQRESAPERFTNIREYLGNFYQTDHELCLARTATLPFAESEILWFELGEFESMASKIDFTHTLYIPPASTPSIRNDKLHEKIHSEEHLDQITKNS